MVPKRAAARQDRVRGDAGAGLARRQGHAGALGRARHGAQCAHLRALELRQARGHRSARHAARHAHLRRGGDRGTAGRHRHRLLQGRGADFDPPRAGQARRRRRDLRSAGGGQHQRRHDRAERLGRRRHHRPHLHGAGRRLPARDRRADKAKGQIGYDRLDGATDVAKVSVIGIGMRSHAGVAAQAFKALAEQRHQHPRHHHVGDQVLAADRRRLHRTCGAHAAFAVRAGQMTGDARCATVCKDCLQLAISYAQRFEDLYLMRCFGERADGFYIDIGSGHPVYDNVSFAFYLRGWRGITVEPNPWLAQLTRAVRPRDRHVEALVGARRGRSHLLSGATISTASRP